MTRARRKPSSLGDTPTGYYYNLFGCTSSGTTGAQRCATGSWLIVGSAVDTYISHADACSNPSCPAGLCCISLHQERGWYARFQVYALDATLTPSDTPAPIYAEMGQTAVWHGATVVNVDCYCREV